MYFYFGYFLDFLDDFGLFLVRASAPKIGH